MRWRALGCLLVALLAAACTATSDSSEPVVLEVWFHQAEGPERSLLENQVRRFNEAREHVTVLLRVLPEVSYPEQVAEATERGEVPDLLDVNRTMLATDAAGRLRPVGALLDADVRARLVPALTTVGQVGRRLVAVPVAAHAVVLAAEGSALRTAGVPVPGGVDDPWTLTELEGALVDLTTGSTPALRLPAPGEGLSAVLEVLVRSAGGDLVSGALGDPANVMVATVVGRWLRDDLATTGLSIDPTEDDQPPLALVPSETIRDADVVASPPDLGAGPATAPTGFAWAVPAGRPHEAEVIDFVSFLLQPEEVAATAEVTGGAPVVRDVAAVGSRGRRRQGGRVAELLTFAASSPLRADDDAVERLDAFEAAVLAVGRGDLRASAALADG